VKITHFFDVFCVVQQGDIKYESFLEGNRSSIIAIWNMGLNDIVPKHRFVQCGAKLIEFGTSDFMIPTLILPREQGNLKHMKDFKLVGPLVGKRKEG